MRNFILIIGILLTTNVFAQEIENENYNAELATKLGGDDYGMKKYCFVLLTTGENKSTDKAFRDSCFVGHMTNINRLVGTGELVVAGPFMSNTEGFRGLFILNVEDPLKAEELLQTDPAIKEGFLAAKVIPWYGSAALPEYLNASDQIWRKNF